MSRYYGFLYAWGFTAWEADAENVAPELRTLVDRVKDGLERSFGAAPDLGCRRGQWSPGLGERGWGATGIDVMPKAVRDARRRADHAGVAGRFAEESVTALRDAGGGTWYRFVLDIECDPSP